MDRLEKEICELSREILTAFLGLEIRPWRGRFSGAVQDRELAATVSLSGGWEGDLVVQWAAPVARRAAAHMLGIPIGAVTQADMEDALGEVANIFAGNLKSSLGAPCRQSLPASIDPVDPDRSGRRLLSQVTYDCGGMQLTLLVLEHVARDSHCDTKVQPPGQVCDRSVSTEEVFQMKTRILIADDSRLIRTLIRNALTEVGHEVVGEARDGQEALELFDQLKPDLVTLDLTMPGREGMSALREIRKIDDHARVVIVSSLGHDLLRNEALESGATSFVTKPFRAEDLTRTVSEAMRS